MSLLDKYIKNYLEKKGKGDYLGGTVQVIPHVTNLIKDFIKSDVTNEDFIICEIGGTVGDIEGLPFFEAIRQFGNDQKKDNVLYIHVTLVPYIKAAKELKSKPTQHSVKELRSIGITPNILICRSERYITKKEKDKIALFCNLDQADVIQAIDKNNIYQVPLELQKQGLDRQVLNYFNLENKGNEIFSKWLELEQHITDAKQIINIAIVGKYTSLSESYKSILESLDHAGYELGNRINIKWIDARKLDNDISILEDVDGILVPGAFGIDGSKGKISAIKFARENKIPYLGICYGMQMAVIEFARNVLKLETLSSSELTEDNNINNEQLIGLMTEWENSGNKETRNENSDLGGTMRLGSYPCQITPNTLAHKIYQKEIINERHRHRYEVNIKYKNQFEQNGAIFSGLSPDGQLPEIMEITDHPFFCSSVSSRI